MTLGFLLYFDKAKKVPTHFPEKILASMPYMTYVVQRQIFFETFPNYPWFCAMEKPKYHTIREDKKDRWRAGMDIHFVVGNRTPHRYQFAPITTCKSKQEIEITPGFYLGETVVKIDGRKLSFAEMQKLAWNDGFSNFAEFAIYFNEGFSGYIIHWTNLKY